MRTSTIAILVSAALLAACAPRTEFVDTACTAFVPITYSATADSEATKSQIRGHNAAWTKVCK